MYFSDCAKIIVLKKSIRWHLTPFKTNPNPCHLTSNVTFLPPCHLTSNAPLLLLTAWQSLLAAAWLMSPYFWCPPTAAVAWLMSPCRSALYSPPVSLQVEVWRSRWLARIEICNLGQGGKQTVSYVLVIFTFTFLFSIFVTSQCRVLTNWLSKPTFISHFSCEFCGSLTHFYNLGLKTQAKGVNHWFHWVRESNWILKSTDTNTTLTLLNTSFWSIPAQAAAGRASSEKQMENTGHLDTWILEYLDTDSPGQNDIG